MTSIERQITKIMCLVDAEVTAALKTHSHFNSCHEAYAVILEELDEFWEEVKKKKQYRNADAMRQELVQIAAVAIKAIISLDLPLEPNPKHPI